MAHRARRRLGKLNVSVPRRGAYGSEVDCSPEFQLASVARGRGRGRGCSACRSKVEGALDAQSHCGDASVKEEARGGRILPVDVVGEEDKRGGGGSLSKSRLWGARGRMGGTGRKDWEWGVC